MKETNKLRAYCNLVLFSTSFSTLSGDCLFDDRDGMCFAFLLLMNSENDGIGDSSALGEALSMGESHVGVCDPMPE